MLQGRKGGCAHVVQVPVDFSSFELALFGSPYLIIVSPVVVVSYQLCSRGNADSRGVSCYSADAGRVIGETVNTSGFEFVFVKISESVSIRKEEDAFPVGRKEGIQVKGIPEQVDNFGSFLPDIEDSYVEAEFLSFL